MTHASVTQIIDLMEGLRCSTLPLVCERVVEVQYRDWLLAPSLQKDGSFNRRKKPPGEETAESENDDAEGNVFFFFLLYILTVCFYLKLPLYSKKKRNNVYVMQRCELKQKC